MKTAEPQNVVIKTTSRRETRKKLPKNFYNPNCIKDRKFGDKNETIVSNVLEKWFQNSEFENDKSGWRVIDYVDKKNKICVELKSRRIKKYAFDSIMIGNNKYIKSRKMMLKGYKAFFLFKFLDRISFYPVPIILPKSVFVGRGGTDKRGKDEWSDCLFIPMDLLYDIKDYDNYEDFKTKTQMI